MRPIATAMVVCSVLAGGGCLDGETSRPAGGRCSTDETCEATLVCRYGRCRALCEFDGDCAPGQACVAVVGSTTERVCVAAEEGGGCPEGLRPTEDDLCREPCELRTACGEGWVCEAGVCVEGCSPALTGETIALYDLEGSLDDAVGTHHGVAFEERGCIAYEAGPAGCGAAIHFFDECPTTRIELPHDPDWDRVQSIDLWLLPVERTLAGVLSRDAFGEELPGHLSLFQDVTGRLILRIQRVPDQSMLLCSEGPLEIDRWVHVGINLGAPRVELWIDGVQHAGSGFADAGPDGSWRCDSPSPELPWGIDGNENPFTLGALSWDAPEGSESQVTRHLEGGAIDHLRMGAERQDFSVYR